jgi:hypothetical protein
MQFSPDGSKLACAVASAFVEVCDFDINTGRVSPGVKLNADTGLANALFQESSVYGLAFSPSNQLLYVSTLTAPSRLYQIVVGTWQVNLITSGTGVAGKNYDIGQLQLGPDKKIYVARDGSNTISAITSPDFVACGFVQVGATLAPGTNSRLGLPTIIQGPFSCSGVTVSCPRGTRPTVVNGVTFCCPITPTTDRFCCTRPCPPGSVETTINGVTYCCQTGLHGPIDANTLNFCCTPK